MKNPIYKQYTARLTDRNDAELAEHVLKAIELSPARNVYSDQTEFSLSIRSGVIDYDRTDEWRNQIDFQVAIKIHSPPPFLSQNMALSDIINSFDSLLGPAGTT